jgi:RNA polymerase sigma-70 factor (ECF subfamily)
MKDSELLQSFVTKEDPDAFRRLIERHGAMVLAVCRSVLGQHHDVEDAFQSTFLILAKSAGSIKQAESIGPWLHRVALRVSRRARYQACERRHREASVTPFQGEPSGHTPDESFIPLLREEISRLPDHYRLPVVLCYLEGKTNEQAAAELRCPVGTVKGRLSRARDRLRHRLARRGLDAYTTPLARVS